ncbi:MAG: hypothetical protein LUE87_07295, partial [Lachnospiraceae bacterium]|nr:hypothetical protein [Lachnospiraceae bacterium]
AEGRGDIPENPVLAADGVHFPPVPVDRAADDIRRLAMNYPRGLSRYSIGKRILILCLIVALVMFIIGFGCGYAVALWRG